MKILSQRDPLWSEKKLGSSSLTMGKYGCTTTCLSMLTDYYGSYMRPDAIASQKDWYTDKNYKYGAGLVLWSKMKLPMKFVKRTYGRDDIEFEKALKDPKRAVMFEVQGKHWVLGLSKSIFGGYRIADPWFGDKATTARYKDQITGAAFFTI